MFNFDLHGFSSGRNISNRAQCLATGRQRRWYIRCDGDEISKNTLNLHNKITINIIVDIFAFFIIFKMLSKRSEK